MGVILAPTTDEDAPHGSRSEARTFAAVVRATVTAELAERVLGIKPATLRKWVQRGYVRRVGRARYDLGDVRERWMLSADGDGDGDGD